ncbi:hypothetical protein SMICM304S_05116 [Streptomyces microflavus]
MMGGLLGRVRSTENAHVEVQAEVAPSESFARTFQV